MRKYAYSVYALVADLSYVVDLAGFNDEKDAIAYAEQWLNDFRYIFVSNELLDNTIAAWRDGKRVE